MCICDTEHSLFEIPVYVLHTCEVMQTWLHQNVCVPTMLPYDRQHPQTSTHALVGFYVIKGGTERTDARHEDLEMCLQTS